MEYTLSEIRDGTGWAPDQRFSTVERYNGWKNYETWNVALWLDNDEGSYNAVREMAREAADRHDRDGDDRDEAKRTTAGELADALKDHVTEGYIPDLDASMAADLLGAALSEVDWYEIAEHYLDDVSE